MTSAHHLALSPLHFLERAATVFRDRPAVVDGDLRLTYGQWADRLARTVAALRAHRVQRGDRVAVLAPNSAGMLDAHFAVPGAGAVLVPLNTRLTAAELSWIIDHSGASLLLVHPDCADLARDLQVSCALLGFDELGEELALTEPSSWHTADEDDLLSINYTSGTTGRPRGVVYLHRGAHQQALAMVAHGRLGADTRHLWTLPMFHCNGWAFVWAVTAAGGTHVCLPRPDAGEVWRLLDTEAITGFNAAPTVLHDIAAHPSARAGRPVRVGTGGAPPSPTLLGALAELGMDVTHYYGLTETYGPSLVCEFPAELASASIREQAAFKARQGNCNIAGVPVRVVDDQGHDVPADARTMGEVVVRGNTVAAGYYRDPEATERAFGGGWFRTGDLAVMHPDSYLELRDRSKDIIISGGENVSSIEVEQVLQRHPDVAEVAVVAMAHERWGEVPVAFVTLRPGASEDPESLIAFAREHLPGFKTPKAVHYGDLPKTSTGKIQKVELRSRLAGPSDGQAGPGR
ncbi:AMP-binding protein [Nocardioides marmoribigeumensis]|uniref:Fatty-acyl-CoA synthase n=1 Tax=Nocardioides marmoribigeumensis TaxID=433649 RepID=A0ABU2BPA6_9ACTN|nr:AMP-binding protein [Nocardioides marmoribigeumensis]MDR7360475.1 fatty-acyl-CoA synthase [Nocardioides marmoribigeumensis]